MPDNMKNDILASVSNNENQNCHVTSSDASAKFKDPQVLQHSLDSVFKSPQTLNENAGENAVKGND